MSKSIVEVDNTDSKYLNETEIKSIMSIIDDDELKLIILFGWDTGCRVSELCTLQWQNINFEKCRVRIWDEKKDKFRNCSISTRTRDLLKQMYDVLDKRKPYKYVFLARKGRHYAKPISYKTVNRELKRLALKAGITRRVHWHMMRKSLVRRWIKSKKSVREVCQQTGDSPITIHLHYDEPDDEDMNEVVEAMALGC